MAAEGLKLLTTLRYDPALLEIPRSGLGQPSWNSENASPLYMLDYHRDRMLRAATHWGWEAAVDALSGAEGLSTLSKVILRALEGMGDAPAKVRVTITEDGGLAVQASGVPEKGLANLFPSKLPAPGETEQNDGLPSRDPAYEVVPDTQKTGRSEYTHFKTTRRLMYEGARNRAGISLTDLKEVIMINEGDDTVMEGSTTSLYFWRHGRWVTPPVSRRVSPHEGSGGNDGTSRRWALESRIVVEEPVKASSLQDGEECWLSSGARGFFFGRIKLD